jgi:predicted RNA-binding Zn-ribbon protein involved in translation (DUF1610 family)
MAKRGKWRENTTRLGKYIQHAMDASGIEVNGVCRTLGIRFEQFANLMTSRNQSIYVPWIFRLATIPGISAIKLLMILYGDQAIAADLTEDEIRMYSQLLLLFDRFYHLQDQDQDLAVKMVEELLRNRGGRILSMQQQGVIEKLRISPSYKSGAGVRQMEERIKENVPIAGGTAYGTPILEEAPSTCSKCGGTTFYRDGHVRRHGRGVQRYKCKTCHQQVIADPALVE